ncbi:hypothetical protein [Candidatus Contubernalis alkaliaceticus]|uniref:hypothetical protein n=1 Tax=Candidatus Contubernalis alkaliaceticus TaxID=338645 RepID=UPI001F4BEB26|nr:hypothetical protein [Candidatus Contubernalis alkalaceticus]UNC91655.1 hypothetical protein HUE98_05850 [Candidatus Contubernalis alkalaceticus]
MQKVIRINRDQILKDARDVAESTEYPAVREFMKKVIGKVMSREYQECVEVGGTLYPNSCSWCEKELGESASVNEAFPEEIYCGGTCEAERFASRSKVITIREAYERKGVKGNLH